MTLYQRNGQNEFGRINLVSLLLSHKYTIYPEQHNYFSINTFTFNKQMLTVAFIHCEKQHTAIHNSEDGQLQVDVSCIFSHNEFLIRRFMAHFFFFFGTPPRILPLNVSE